MDELKSLNLTLGFYFFLKPKKPKFGLFRFFRFFLKNLKKPRFFKAMSNSPASHTW